VNSTPLLLLLLLLLLCLLLRFAGSLAHWLGLCAAALATINLLQYILDRQEKFAVLKRDRELAGVTNTFTAKDVTDDGGSPNKHSGSWVARKLTASNLKRHQAATAAEVAAAQPPDALGGESDGLGMPSHGDIHDDMHNDVGAGFGARGFGEPSGGDVYAYDGPDHGIFGQPPQQQQQHYQSPQQQQQQYQPGDPDQQFSFGPGPSAAAAVNSQQQQSYGQPPLPPPLQQQQERVPPQHQPFRRF
jgi:hypothetical protein